MANDRLSLGILTQMVMDLYYQDYPGRDAFIDESQIAPYIGLAYSRMLNESYKTSKTLNKAMTGFSWVEVSSDWLADPEIVEISKQTDGSVSGNLTKKPFSFEFDSVNSAVQTVETTWNDSRDLVRIGLLDQWKLKRIPLTSKIFYLVDQDRIVIVGDNGFPSKVKVRYVPAIFPIDDTFSVSENKGEELIKESLQLLLIARNGVVVDKTDDSNPNRILQTEINADSVTSI